MGTVPTGIIWGHAFVSFVAVHGTHLLCTAPPFVTIHQSRCFRCLVVRVQKHCGGEGEILSGKFGSRMLHRTSMQHQNAKMPPTFRMHLGCVQSVALVRRGVAWQVQAKQSMLKAERVR
jgi:hypothetical protein